MRTFLGRISKMGELVVLRRMRLWAAVEDGSRSVPMSMSMSWSHFFSGGGGCEATFHTSGGYNGYLEKGLGIECAVVHRGPTL